MSEEREQRLVDLAFIIGQACSMPALAGAGQERVCAYVSALLAESGFETEPTKHSHGILKPAKTVLGSVIVNTTPGAQAGAYRALSPVASLEGFLRAAVAFVHEKNSRKKVLRSESKAEQIMAMVSLLSLAYDGWASGAESPEIAGRSMIEVELATLLLHILSMAGASGYDLAGAFRDKMERDYIKKTAAADSRQGDRREDSWQ